jgi:DNA-binding transcriptional LysR family regulator
MPEVVITHRMIEALSAAVVHGGISAGADALGIPQPTISRSISNLQKAVGYPLFRKNGRTVVPTDEALMLMSKVRQSFIGMEEISSFSDQIRKQRMGRLSICTIPSIGNSIMPALIEKLRAKFPDVLFSITVASFIEVGQKVRNRQADIGLTAVAHSIGGALETVAEYESNCVCIGTSKWFDASAKSIELAELAGKPFITAMGTFGRELDAIFIAHGVQVDKVVEASLFHTISDLVLLDMGVSVVDPLTGANHRSRGGITLPLHPSIKYTVYATALSDTKLSEPGKEFLRYLSAANKSA